MQWQKESPKGEYTFIYVSVEIKRLFAVQGSSDDDKFVYNFDNKC